MESPDWEEYSLLGKYLSKTNIFALRYSSAEQYFIIPALYAIDILVTYAKDCLVVSLLTRTRTTYFSA